VHLTIAIPTWNRARYLKENLEALLHEIALTQELITIVVSDNASSDDTESMVAELISNGAPITYWRNDLNLGFDKNVHLAVLRSEGDFVLLLGDDDRLEENALSEVFAVLNRYADVSLIYMNSRVYDSELKDEIDFHDVAFDRFEGDAFFSNGLEVLAKSQKIFPGISGCVFRQALWQKAKPEQFFESRFMHLGVGLSILCELRSPAYVFKKPLLKYRMNLINADPLLTSKNIKPYQEIFPVSFGLLNIIKKYKKFMPRNLYNIIYGKERHWTREKILGAKARESVPALTTFRQMKCNYDTEQISFWVLDVPLLFIPHWLLKIPYQLYRRIKY
jgi:glycosyltransferase involved in cell wall biosynthesis